jgi:OmpA-OmpF porin, OOP family
MRKLVIGMALASTAVAAPALAREGSWYVEIDGGAMIVEDMDFDVGATNNAVTIDHDYGYDFGGIVGYDFGPFRVEIEASFREADPDELTTATGFRIPAATSVSRGGSGTGTYDGVAGDTNVLSFMLNGLVDFGPDDGLQGFIGGGAGVARVNVQNSINRLGPGFLDDSDSGFAWQAIAGVRAPLTANWDVGLKYRFFNAPNIELVDSGGRPVETKWRSHSILGTFAYNFGGVEPPPPPPVEAPPPPIVETPPPPPPVCNRGPYIVFFDWDRADITPEAASILDSAVSAYTNCGSAAVMLAGHADRSGSARYNVGLSQRRNESVRQYLVSRGVNSGSISTQAFGESMPRVPTADGVRELQNRRVEITYGPGSGF